MTSNSSALLQFLIKEYEEFKKKSNNLFSKNFILSEVVSGDFWVD